MKVSNIITSKEAAEIICCSHRNVQKLVDNGKLKPLKVLDNRWLIFDIEKVKEYKKNLNCKNQ